MDRKWWLWKGTYIIIKQGWGPEEEEEGEDANVEIDAPFKNKKLLHLANKKISSGKSKAHKLVSPSKRGAHEKIYINKKCLQQISLCIGVHKFKFKAMKR